MLKKKQESGFVTETLVKSNITIFIFIICALAVAIAFGATFYAAVVRIRQTAKPINGITKQQVLERVKADIEKSKTQSKSLMPAEIKNKRELLIEKEFSGKKDSEKVKVVVVLNTKDAQVDQNSANLNLGLEKEVLDFSVDSAGKPIIKLNGEDVTQQELEVYNKDLEVKINNKNKAIQTDVQQKVNNLLNPNLSDKSLTTRFPNAIERASILKRFLSNENNKQAFNRALLAGSDTITLELTRSEYKQLKTLAEKDSAILAIELYEEPQTEAQIISLDDVTKLTQINPYSFDTSSKGSGIGILQLEVCPPLKYESGVERRGYTILGDNNRMVGNDGHGGLVFDVLRKTAPFSRIYCRDDAFFTWNMDLSSGVSAPIYILNYSAGSNKSTGIYRIVDRDFDKMVYERDISIFKSAGNVGNDYDKAFVTSPGKAANVITVGNYQKESDGKYLIHPVFSSWRNPDIGYEKPELVAPATRVRGFSYDNRQISATSIAAPMAAGLAASLLSSDWGPRLIYRPESLKAQLMAGALDVVDGGSDKVGVGGINYRGSYYDLSVSSWRADGKYKLSDVFPNDLDYIEVEKKVAPGKSARAVLTWLQDPDYLYNNQELSACFGIFVLERSSDDNLFYPLKSSLSRKNSFQMIEFTNDSTETKTYLVTIYRTCLRSPDMKLKMSLAWKTY